jgi:uncharacterized protein YebE (UPF0316 family)
MTRCGQALSTPGPPAAFTTPRAQAPRAGFERSWQMESFFAQHAWLLVPVIFFARVADVSLGTCRAIIVVRGHRVLAAGIGFFESLIWLLAVSAVIARLDAWYLALAYGAGFATGNYVGIWLEARLAIGSELVRAIVFDATHRLTDKLRERGYQAVQLTGNAGAGRPVEVILVVEKRRRVPQLLSAIQREAPGAVYTISDVKSVYEGPASALAQRAAGMDWLLTKRR